MYYSYIVLLLLEDNISPLFIVVIPVSQYK